MWPGATGHPGHRIPVLPNQRFPWSGTIRRPRTRTSREYGLRLSTTAKHLELAPLATIESVTKPGRVGLL